VPAAIAGAGDTAVRRFRILRRHHPQQEHPDGLLPSISSRSTSPPIEALQERMAKPTVKQHLAAIRMLFDWLVTGGILASIKRGKTPCSPPTRLAC
jgi:hypothetical protein